MPIRIPSPTNNIPASYQHASQFKIIASKAQIGAAKCAANIWNRIYLLCMMPLMLCCDFWRCFLQSKWKQQSQSHTNIFTNTERARRLEQFSWRFNEKMPDFVPWINFLIREISSGNATGMWRKRLDSLRASGLLNNPCDIIYEDSTSAWQIYVSIVFRISAAREKLFSVAHRAPVAYKKSAAMLMKSNKRGETSREVSQTKIMSD